MTNRLFQIEKAYESFADFHIKKLKNPFENPVNYREEWQRIINEQNLKIVSFNLLPLLFSCSDG